MNIPSWAPSDLVDAIPDLEEDAKTYGEDVHPDEPVSCKETLGWLLNLVTDSRMEDVWRRLERRADSFRWRHPELDDADVDEDQAQTGSYSRALYFECVEAVRQWRFRPKKSRAEERNIHAKIAMRANELSELLRTDIGSMIYDWNSFEEFRALSESNPQIWFKGLGLPSLAEFFAQFEKIAQAKAENPWSLARPHQATAQERFVALSLSDHFTRCYGTPLNEIAATVTSVILSVDVSEDHVRAWVRTRRKGASARDEMDR